MYHSVELGGAPAIVYDPNAANRDGDVRNIDYVIGEDSRKNRQFKANLMRELTLRSQNIPFDRDTPIEDLRRIVRPRMLLL
jgi:hypothetical protein